MPVQGWGSAWGGSPNTAAGPDFEVLSPPDETVSSLSWDLTRAQGKGLLLATSWDAQARIWEVVSSNSTVPKAAQQFLQPVLCSAWAPDGTAAFVGAYAAIISVCNSRSHCDTLLLM